jgi:glycosyltransferase involved in cell wall biosynthesis
MRTQNSNTRKLRVMHVILTLGVGGAEQLVYRMVNSRPRFEDNIVCCLYFIGELGEQYIRDGGKVYCRNHSGGFNIGIVWWLINIIRHEKIDVVHAHTYATFFYSVLAAKIYGNIKLVYTEHGRLYPDRSSWKRSIINPLLALGVSHIVSISESTAKAMNKYDNLPLEKINVIHNGITLPATFQKVDIAAKKRSLGLAEPCRVIGTASRLEEIKNIPMMLRAFQYVSQQIPDVCLLVAGTGSKTDELIACSQELGICDKVKFIGLRNDLWEIYQILDVFLLSSFTEGISVTLLEAMASGVPAVVTDVGGNPEVVDDGVTGCLVPLNDDIAMAQRILVLLQHDDMAKRFSLNSVKRVEKYFSFDEMMKTYEILYNS